MKNEIGRKYQATAVCDTPTGKLAVAASPNGLAWVSFLGADYWQDFAKEKEQHADLAAQEILEKAIQQIQEYFDLQRKAFDLPLDFESLSDFRRRVLAETQHIPFGKTLTYGDVAERIGQPAASRAVGGALAHNPLALVIPCHRVIASDGSLHGFSSPGGIATKALLLKHEGVRVVNERVIKETQ